MMKLVLPVVFIATVALGVAAFAMYSTSTSSSDERADCPGKIVCPLTGELICEDQCPIESDSMNLDTEKATNVQFDATRDDCPGLIVCPLTGDLVCKDRCPLGATTDNNEAAALPSCCESSN